jgi:tRNA(His) 5'-end guanylyltransferase
VDQNQFDRQMRQLEYFHSWRLLPETWVIIRVDGRSFSHFTKSQFEKPYDRQFHQFMVQTSQKLVEEMNGIYAYTESDEISVLFPPDWEFFDRSLEKVVSISASIATATFSIAAKTAVNFDSRVWLGVNPSLVVDYFRWRQADATRCALNSLCYWTLRNLGKSAGEATQELDGKSIADKNELLFQNGINFNELPLWQRRGTGLYWENHSKIGYNPIIGQEVVATRRRIKIDEALPMKEAYSELIAGLLESRDKVKDNSL